MSKAVNDTTAAKATSPNELGNSRMLGTEVNIFFTALMFYTRIPCPRWVTHDADYLNKATRYFPFIGWIVGAISFGVFYAAQFFLGASIATSLGMAAAIFTTGAFHEDGFGDVCDGFGGGWTKEKILTIMKDSRIGAYGAIGLCMLLLLKFTAFTQLASAGLHWQWLLLVYIMIHALARLTAISISFIIPYVRDDETSKAKPIAKSFSWKVVTGVLFFGLLPLAILISQHWMYVWVLLPMIALIFFASRYFKKWLDGYTGDCLGAAEQLAELIIPLTLLVIWKYI
jgi:adenosylcobinamide-GDP ribazoletransferase